MFALVDCNNFFVSCERLFRPDIAGLPAVVLSNNDGCVVARSNEVKALGVPMGVPYFKVKDLFKRENVQVFSANFALYGNMSWRVTEVLRTFTPRIEIYSVDESFLGLDTLPVDDFEAWGVELKRTVQQWTGIPVSVGIAPSKTLAKLATELAKRPEENGVVSLANLSKEELYRQLARVSVTDVWGVGRQFGPRLRERGIATAADLAKQPQKWAQTTMTVRGQQMIMELNGIACHQIDDDDSPQKSIARTRSFGHNVRSYHEIEAAVANFSVSVAAKLRREKELACELTVFINSSRHVELERRHSVSTKIKLPHPSADSGIIAHYAIKALQMIHDPDFAYKRAGVIASNLVPDAGVQQSLLETRPLEYFDRRVDLFKTLDMLNYRLGQGTVQLAAQGTGNAKWKSLKKKSSNLNLRSTQHLPVVRAH